MPRYQRRFRKRNNNYKRFAKHVAKGTSSLVGYSARAFAGPVLASLAKRFITTYVSQPVTLAIPYKSILTEIPRSIADVDAQQNRRVGKKIWIKGLSVYLRMDSTVATTSSTIRIVFARQSDPTENLDITTMFAPVGSTTGIKILRDTFMTMQQSTTAQDSDTKQFHRYIKVDAPLLFNGDQIDGTDTDEGTLVMYHYTSDANGYNVNGAVTVHFRELL